MSIYTETSKGIKTDFNLMRARVNELVDLAIKKDASYGSSWKKRGGPGAFLTAVRKFDRLEAQVEKVGYDVFDVSVAPEDGESIDETLKDAINYCLLILVERELIRGVLGPLKTVHPLSAHIPPINTKDIPIQPATNPPIKIQTSGTGSSLTGPDQDSGVPGGGYVNQG